MDPTFWHERWSSGRTHFHRGSVDTLLETYLERLSLADGARVFVPLCGKSVDMRWLAERGFEVLGVELSRIAARAFFEENALACTAAAQGSFERLRAGPVEILCGDFFNLGRSALGDVSGVYDRAALIALPESMRAAYAAHLLRLLPARPPCLLITLEYDAGEMNGPPFSVSADEVQALFGQAYQIEMLSEAEALADSPHLAERGLTWLQEKAWLLT